METCLTIYATFEGLGFGCFNSERGGAEIAFLRVPEHNLKIEIFGGDGRHHVIEDIPDDAKIELISEGTLISDYRLNDSGDFDRRSGFNYRGNDPSDLRWLVDFEGEQMHNRRAAPQNQKPRRSVRGLTGMFLPHAYFFTEQVLSAEYELEKTDVATGKITTEPFGLVGDTLGAKIDAFSAALLVDEKEVFRFDENLNSEIVTRFFLTVTNNCERKTTDEPHTDFQKYYEVLDFQQSARFDFRPAAGTAKTGPRPAICEFILLGKTNSLTPFFPKSQSEEVQ